MGQSVCPRCGLVIDVEHDRWEGDGLGGKRHTTSTFTPSADGCVKALGRAVRELQEAIRDGR